MKVKEFVELGMDKYCGFIIYDEFTNKRRNFTYGEEVISEYGSFRVRGWLVEKHPETSIKMLIKIRSQF